MTKPKSVVPISQGLAESDPGDFTISVGNVPFRFMISLDGEPAMVGPAKLIDFPGADACKKLAKSGEESDECPDRGNHRAGRTKMKAFTIDTGTNNITVHTTIQAAEARPNAQSIRNEAALAKLAAEWPAARLVEIWNSLPGAAPVKKFTDRKTAVSRIWKALQSLDNKSEVKISPEPAVVPVIATRQEAILGSSDADVADTVAPQSAHVAPEKAPAKNKASGVKKAPKAAGNATVPRAESKTSQVIALLKREGGTTLQEIMAATDWQKHTIRAMLSAGGSLTKKHGLVVMSEKVGDKRSYSIQA